MPWNTIFLCSNAKFCTTDSFGSPFAAFNATCDRWSSAKISVQDIGLGGPWLWIKLEEGDAPIVFRAIKEDWMISCDERSLTITMQPQESEAFTSFTQKVRFERPKDFWTVMTYMGAGRAHEYASRRAEGPIAGGSQATASY